MVEVEVEAFVKGTVELTHKNFEIKLNYDQYDEENEPVEPFPSDYTLAKLASFAYEKSKTLKIPPCLQGWEVLTSANNKDGYRGVAYFNPKLCHVVIAHRGTELTNVGALFSDYDIAVKKEIILHGNPAAHFAYLVAEKVKKVNSLNENEEDKPPFRLIITGHSLGAWLAQYTTFTIKYLTLNTVETTFIADNNYLINIHPHTVVFESPGCKESLDKLVQKLCPVCTPKKYGNYDALDMTVYINKSCPWNCVNRHAGTIYMLPINGHSIDKVVNYLADGEVDKEVVLEKKSGKIEMLTQLFNMLLGTNIQNGLKTTAAKYDRCNLNVFDESELRYVKNYYDIKSQNRLNMENIEEKYRLPEFKLNKEFNLLKGEYFKKVILIVKNLRPNNRRNFFTLLSHNLDDPFLFKYAVRLCKEKLLDFNGYYCIDKYGLLVFLQSDQQLFHVRVDSDSSIKYEFETSIVHNILMFYQTNEPNFDISENEIAFIDWYKLCEYVDDYPNIVNDNNYKLLVIEYYFEDKIQSSNIITFFNNTNVKVIILSTNQISFKKGEFLKEARLTKNITEINGFGSKLSFGDLNDKSKNKFLTQIMFKFNNQTKCINDLFSNTVFNGNWATFLSSVSISELILLKESNTLVVDGQYSNLLNTVYFYHVYCEIDQNRLLENVGKSEVLALPEDNTNCESYEQKCFDNTAEIQYMVTNKNDKMYLIGIFNKKFYIPRSIIVHKNVNSNIFKNTDEGIDSYIFYGDKNTFDKNLASRQTYHFTFAPSAENAMEIAKLSKSKNVHVFNINQDGTIDWKRSYGSISSLQAYMQSEEVNEYDIMNDDQIVIISGGPGSGKSSLIEHLYLTLQSKYWIFIVQLKNVNFDEISKELSYDEVAKFVTNNCSYDAKSVEQCLSLCLRSESQLQIYLMLDSFEEIGSEEDRIKIINIINFLKDNSNAKILITALPDVCKQLEDGISVFSSKFKEMNCTEIVNFLREFWKSKLFLSESAIQEDILVNAAKDIMKATCSISDTIEIPMSLRMLAETVNPNVSITSQFSNVLRLFEEFIEKRCKAYLEKFSIDSLLMESILGYLKMLSVQKLLSVNLDHQFNEEEMKHLYNTSLIILDCINLNYKFWHESLCEYFLSDSLKQWLTCPNCILFGRYEVAKFLISDLFLNTEYKKVRLYLNFHLEKSEIFFVRIRVCRSKLVKIYQNNTNVSLKENIKPIIDICNNENLENILKKFINKLLE